ncbi:MAG: S9 family peptidase [Pseudomonadota bacterium]
MLFVLTRRFLSILALAVAALPTVVHSQLKADSILDWRYVADPRWSPIDELLIYTAVTTDRETDTYRSQLRLIDAAGVNRPLTEAASNAFYGRWSPDGQRIAFLTNRRETTQVWVVDRRGGEAYALTEIDGAVSSFAWSPDGQTLALIAASAGGDTDAPFTTTGLRIRRDGARGFVSQRAARLGLVSSASAKADARWLADGLPVEGVPVWDQTGDSVFIRARASTDELYETNLYRVAVDSGVAEPFAHGDGPEQILPSPDGRWLALVGFRRASPPASYQTTEIRLFDLLEDSAERSLTDEFKYSIGDGMNGDVNAPVPGGQRIAWLHDSSALLFTSAIDGQVQIVRVEPDAAAPQLVTEIDAGELREFDVSPTGQVAAVFSRFDLPANLVAFDALKGSRGAWRQLTNDNSDLLRDIELAGFDEVRIPAEEGSDAPALQAWLISPPKLDRRRRYPLLLYIHGGPHSMYGTNFFHEFQVLAAAGYHVLLVNPRGSTGYGGEFGNSIQYRFPGDDGDDLLRALDFVLADASTIDESRIGVVGGSGGGLLTTWLIGQTDRFAAASAHRSVTNWLSFVGTADLNQFFIEHWFENTPWGDPETYLKYSPISYVENVTTPVQILHSDRDYRTPFEQSLQYYTALRALNKPAELVVFRDESHGLSRSGRPSNRLARLQAVLRWFNQHLETERR